MIGSKGFGGPARGAILIGALALAGCQGGDGGSSTIGPTPGTLKVWLTASPACGYDNLNLTVTKLRFSTSASADPASKTGWSEIAVDPAAAGRLDLLAYTNGGAIALGQADIPNGIYQQIRLVLATNSGTPYANSVVPNGGTEAPLDTTAAQPGGLLVAGTVTIQAKTATELALDIDACNAVVRRTAGSTYALKDAATAIPVTGSGEIDGTIVGGAGARVYAQRNGKIVKAVLADANGSFTLRPIAQIATPDKLDVVIVPNGLTTAVIRGVPVDQTTPTSIGEVTLQTSLARTVSGAISPTGADGSIRAVQSIAGNTYQIASMPATAISSFGVSIWSYRLYPDVAALPAGIPRYGDYSATVRPIPLSYDTGAAGRYSIEAARDGSTPVSWPLPSVSNGDVSNFDLSI